MCAFRSGLQILGCVVDRYVWVRYDSGSAVVPVVTSGEREAISLDEPVKSLHATTYVIAEWYSV